MKGIMILLFLLPVVLFGQEKTDNILVLTKEGTDKMTLMGEILDILDNKSMPVETVDKDFGRIKTEIITTSKFWGSWFNRYTIKVKDGVFEIRAEFNVIDSGDARYWQFANYKGTKNSVPILTWNLMKEIANEVGGELSYKTK